MERELQENEPLSNGQPAGHHTYIVHVLAFVLLFERPQLMEQSQYIYSRTFHRKPHRSSKLSALYSHEYTYRLNTSQ